MSRIFISYRREDSSGYAGRLYDRLSAHFGRNQIFMDIDTIEPGLDFVKVIEKAVGACDVLIALIGPRWLTAKDAQDRRRLDNPEDFVRLEVKAALDRKIRVIPVLVAGMAMPTSRELPEALVRLARRNALEISDTRFHHDVDRLIQGLEKMFGREATNSLPQPKLTPSTRRPIEPELILIPAGEFLMGSDPTQDKAAQDNEQPQHRLYLPNYQIAKTPVTNAQFTTFIKATGHRTTAETAGWGWVWTGRKREKISGTDWRHPAGPKSNIAGKSDHPVVQLSWHDAVAYCRWLAEVTGKAYRLPSEAEWEKAARGTDGRLWPWGNQWVATRCNTVEGGADTLTRAFANVIGKYSGLVKGSTTAVGTYPDGASPYGLLDCAGNVWEWTRSLWGQDGQKASFGYPYQPDDGREDLKAGDDVPRVLRGASWYGTQNFARCAYRIGGRPFDGNNGVGCRVAVSPI